MASQIIDRLRWPGHDGFSVSDGALNVVFDPYAVADPPAADLVLVTHPHYDHCSPADSAKVCKGSVRW